MPPRRSLLLISPRGPLYRQGSGIIKKALRYRPLTLALLASLVPEELGFDIQIIDEGVDQISFDAPADLVAISAITGTSLRAYEIAQVFRSRGATVVLGGVHPTLMPEEARQHADAVVIGYAEESWPQLLRDYCRGELKAFYRQESFDVRTIPRINHAFLPRNKYLPFYTLEATRGCHHNCEFCVVPTAWGGHFQRPVADVVDEIRQQGKKHLLFLDLNLVSGGDYARQLFEALVSLRIKWGGLATVDLAFDQELLDLAAKSGCKGLLVGFESLERKSLAIAQKGINIQRNYAEAMLRFHAAGIGIMGCFAFGFDHDDKNCFDATVDFIIQSKIELPRFAILTPFPGTPLFQRYAAEGRILSRQWDLYDGQHVVFRPARMTPSELLIGCESAWKKAYRFSSIARRLSADIPRTWRFLAANLGYRYYGRNLEKFASRREVCACD